MDIMTMKQILAGEKRGSYWCQRKNLDSRVGISQHIDRGLYHVEKCIGTNAIPVTISQ
jgi:hypothetical protein